PAIAGFNHEGKLGLFVEEALFMVENGGLELLYRRIPVSLQLAYAFLVRSQHPKLSTTTTTTTTAAAVPATSTSIPITNGLHSPMNAYTVYAVLRSQGYVVMRPQLYPQFTSSSSKPFKLDDKPVANPQPKRKKFPPVTGSRPIHTILAATSR